MPAEKMAYIQLINMDVRALASMRISIMSVMVAAACVQSDADVGEFEISGRWRRMIRVL
jgi:hypothetical protein